MNQSQHWENVFETKDTKQVSWYQKYPTTSLNLILQNARPEDSIIDVGAGDSALPDALLANSFQKISALDISAHALKSAQDRLGTQAEKLHWIRADVLDLDLDQTFYIWHDRAVFHFMSDLSSQLAYKRVLLEHLAPNGVAILATFHLDNGPTKCSGLEVARHNSTSISEIFGPELTVVESFDEIHQTPNNKHQNFSWNILKHTQ